MENQQKFDIIKQIMKQMGYEGEIKLETVIPGHMTDELTDKLVLSTGKPVNFSSRGEFFKSRVIPLYGGLWSKIYFDYPPNALRAFGFFVSLPSKIPLCKGGVPMLNLDGGFSDFQNPSPSRTRCSPFTREI